MPLNTLKRKKNMYNLKNSIATDKNNTNPMLSSKAWVGVFYKKGNQLFSLLGV